MFTTLSLINFPYLENIVRNFYQRHQMQNRQNLSEAEEPRVWITLGKIPQVQKYKNIYIFQQKNILNSYPLNPCPYNAQY